MRVVKKGFQSDVSRRDGLAGGAAEGSLVFRVVVVEGEEEEDSKRHSTDSLNRSGARDSSNRAQYGTRGSEG